jgi:lysophospholipase L1-like esterase
VIVRLVKWSVRSVVFLLVLALSLEVGLRLAGKTTLWFRARQTGESGQPGAVQLLHLGESTTFGLGVAPTEAYPALVADLLEKRHPESRFVSINRGVPGLVTTSMVQTMDDKLSQIRPAVVTIMAGANDFNEELNRISSGNGVLPKSLSDALANLRIYKAAWLAAQLAQPGVRLDQGEVIYYHHGGSKNILYDTPQDERKIATITERLEANLRSMIRDCRKAGTAVVLIGYIQGYKENQILQHVAQETGVPYVSTYLEPSERPRTLFLADGWHPSPLGHRHIAEQVVGVVDTLLSSEKSQK